MFWQDEPWMNSPSASGSFRFAYDVESTSRKFSKWRCNVSHACSCVCHRVTLGHIRAVGLSPYISLVFPEIFMARGRYLKYFQRFKRKISISATHWNDGIKCLKIKANLWLLHPIHFNNWSLCSKCLLVHFSHQNWRLWCPYRQRACWRFISVLTQKFSNAYIILTAEKWATTSLLMGIRPMKCSEIDWFLKTVA